MITGYLVRHGKTQANTRGISQGAIDFPLTEEGRLHARNLGERLLGLTIGKSITSDLGRAQESAKIINSYLNVQIFIDKLIREISYGKYDGKPDEELIRENPNYRSLLYQFPGGESPNMLLDRVSQFFSNFERNYGNEPFLLVSHSGAIKAMMLIVGALQEHEFYVRKVPYECIGRIKINNGNLSSFEFV